MKVPGGSGAVISKEKITGYLLSRTHQQGRHKAAGFMRFGFAVERWEVLAVALRSHIAQHEAASATATPYGTRYLVDGILETPDGRAPAVRSVWFIGMGEEVPRLVTAYFLDRREGK